MSPPRCECAGWGALCASIALGAIVAHATAGVDVVFDDTACGLSADRSAILENLRAAETIWSRALGAEASFEVVIRVSDQVPTLTARSLAAVFVEHADGLSVYEQGAGYELRTGIDPNGMDPDIEITIGAEYLRDRMWFDPDPIARSTPVPPDRVDAVSSFVHELAHALFMNGWRDPATGRCFDRVASTWDLLVIGMSAGAGEDGRAAWFCGPASLAVFGRPVPLSAGGCHHLGQDDPGTPGQDLADDVLTGVRFSTGRRYELSALDVALAQDVLGIGATGVDLAEAGPPGLRAGGPAQGAPGQPVGE